MPWQRLRKDRRSPLRSARLIVAAGKLLSDSFRHFGQVTGNTTLSIFSKPPAFRKSCKTEGAASAAPSGTVESAVDLNAPRHRSRLLRNRDGQNAILSRRVDLFAIHCIRQYEAPMKVSIASFNATTL
jgi:hypothetical protein